MASAVRQNPLDRIINKDVIQKRTLDPIDSKKKEQQVKVDKSTTKKVDLVKLEGLIKNFQGALADFANPMTNPFETTTTLVTTSDVGQGDEFIDVTARDQTKRTFNVAVKQLARPASVILSTDGENYFDTNNPKLNGQLTITVGGNQDLAVNFDGTEANIGQVITKINNVLQQNGNEFQAFALNLAANESAIEITAKEGVTKNVDVEYINNDEETYVSIEKERESEAVQAHIQIDGMDFYSDSNKFKNVVTGAQFFNDERDFEDRDKGIDIIAKKVNKDANTQNISVGVEDPTNFDKLFTNRMAPAINSLIIFLNQHKMENADPDKPEELSSLAGDTVVNTANDLINLLIGSNGKIFKDMGIELQTAISDEFPAGTKILTIVDEKKYAASLKDLQILREKFVTHTDVTRPANAGLSELFEVRNLVELDSSKNFPLKYNAKEFELKIEIDADENVGNITATMHNGDIINGAYAPANNKITFDKTAIESLELHFDPKGIKDGEFTYKLKHTEGYFNRVAKRSNSLIDPQGNGSMKLALDKTEKDLTAKIKQMTVLDDMSTKAKNRLEMQFTRIDMMSEIGTIMTDAIMEMLNPSK